MHLAEGSSTSLWCVGNLRVVDERRKDLLYRPLSETRVLCSVHYPVSVTLRP